MVVGERFVASPSSEHIMTLRLGGLRRLSGKDRTGVSVVMWHLILASHKQVDVVQAESSKTVLK